MRGCGLVGWGSDGASECWKITNDGALVHPVSLIRSLQGESKGGKMTRRTELAPVPPAWIGMSLF